MDIERRAWKFERWKAFSWDFHCEALSKFVEIPKNHCFLGNVLKCKSLYEANLSASIKFKSKMAFVMLIWNANPLSIRMHIKYHSQLPHHCKICTHTCTHTSSIDAVSKNCTCYCLHTMQSFLENDEVISTKQVYSCTKCVHNKLFCHVRLFHNIYGTILYCKCGTHYEHYTLVILYPFACPNTLPFRRCYSGIWIYRHPCHFTGPHL